MAYTTIDDPSVYFQTALWSGDDATTQNITNDGNSDLQPDWVWVKCRNTAGNGFDHTVWDTSRGVDNNVNKSLSPSQNDSEGLGDNVTTTAQLGGVSAMLSDGFTVREGSVDNDSRYVNENSRTYVGWQWKANGGTTTSGGGNDSVSTSTHQANTTSGFSVVTYTGNGTAGATVVHGLGAVPQIVLLKRRDASGHTWQMYHHSLGNTHYLQLNNTDAALDGEVFNDTTPSSSVFTLHDFSTSNGNNGTFVAYCFAEKQGYSKFGSYTGNADNDGTFVYTGFSPAWLMIKRTDSAQQWNIHDSKRREYNSNTKYVFANLSNAEATSSNLAMDFLSNGFKLRSSDDAQNNGTYIYMAFAESPFVSSKGVPTTAR